MTEYQRNKVCMALDIETIGLISANIYILEAMLF